MIEVCRECLVRPVCMNKTEIECQPLMDWIHKMGRDASVYHQIRQQFSNAVVYTASQSSPSVYVPYMIPVGINNDEE